MPYAPNAYQKQVTATVRVLADTYGGGRSVRSPRLTGQEIAVTIVPRFFPTPADLAAWFREQQATRDRSFGQLVPDSRAGHRLAHLSRP